MIVFTLKKDCIMHEHPTHTLALDLLKRIAVEKRKTLSKIKKQFVVKQNLTITARFWELFHELHPQLPYREIYHCHGCKKFTLE